MTVRELIAFPMFNRLSVLLAFALLLLGCEAPRNTFKPRAYANIRTWDVECATDVTSPARVLEINSDQGGRTLQVERVTSPFKYASVIREDLYYHMLRSGFQMAPKGQVPDAMLKLSFDKHIGLGGIFNLTVFDRNGEPLTRIKYESRYDLNTLSSQEALINELVALLAREVNENR